MGVANRVINIAVLVFSIVAVILAFMLFSKREKLVHGWKQMSNAISMTASTLDLNSGTKVAAELAPKSTDHTQYEKLQALLPKLNDQASKVIKQRDSLADGMRETATTLELQGVEDKDLKDIANYAGKKDDYLGKIRKVQERDMGLISEIRASAKVVGVEIAEATLKDFDNYKEPLGRLNTKIESIKKRIDSYASYINNIAGILGTARPSLDGDDYARSLSEAASSVESYKQSFEQTKKDLASEKSKTQELKGQLDSKENEIASLNGEIKKKDSRIAELNKVIGITEKDENITIYADGSPEALKLTKGKIVEINPKWDFVVIDVGALNRVSQPVGKLKNNISAPVPKDKMMTVARGLAESPEFIGKIKIVKVYDYCSIANVMPVPKGQSSLQVGDIVYFTDEDLAEPKEAPAVEPAKKAANEKKAE